MSSNLRPKLKENEFPPSSVSFVIKSIACTASQNILICTARPFHSGYWSCRHLAVRHCRLKLFPFLNAFRCPIKIIPIHLLPQVSHISIHDPALSLRWTSCFVPVPANCVFSTWLYSTVHCRMPCQHSIPYDSSWVSSHQIQENRHVKPYINPQPGANPSMLSNLLFESQIDCPLFLQESARRRSNAIPHALKLMHRSKYW